MNEKIFDINTASRDDVITVIKGMLNAKDEWIASVRKREEELGLA